MIISLSNIPLYMVHLLLPQDKGRADMSEVLSWTHSPPGLPKFSQSMTLYIKVDTGLETLHFNKYLVAIRYISSCLH